jgi:hypothetical protein
MSLVVPANDCLFILVAMEAIIIAQWAQ